MRVFRDHEVVQVLDEARPRRVPAEAFAGKRGWLWVPALGAILGLASFLVRTVQPLGTSILNFQLCYFSQYVVFFVLGIYVSRRD